jgi:hypothetical protein
MVARRLYVTLQQVIRSILIILFPLAFITLFAWATAGSTYGTTSDPMRAAVWLWLGAHLAPFNIVSNEVTGYLSYLPIGAALFPILAIKNGYNRTVQSLENKKITRSYFILVYFAVYIVLALLASNSQVQIDWIRGLVTPLILLFIATSVNKFESLIKLQWSMFILLLGISGLVFTLSLVLNFSTAKNLSIIIQPGILGGILFVILQILYLPNLFFATFSYLIGSGFSLGQQTNISPLIFDLKEIPAIPALAALPSGKLPWLLVFSILIPIYGWINLSLINKVKLDSKSVNQLKLRFIFISVSFLALVSIISSGSLLTENMSPVGVNPLLISAVIALHLLLVMLIMYLYPLIFKKKAKQGRLKK